MKPKKKTDSTLFDEEVAPRPEPKIKPERPRRVDPAARAAVEAEAHGGGKAVARHEPAPPAPAVSDPFVSMIREVALNKDLDVTKLDALLQMQERIMERQNREAFDRALAAMQSELPVIDRNGRIEVRKKDAQGERTGDIQQSTAFAKWEDIVEEVAPVLQKHGFALRFKPGNTEKGLISIEATLSGHGHREVADLALVHESSGNKNPIQAIASTISYGKRILGCALLNIVTRGEDDDGKGGGAPMVVGESMSAEELEQVVALAVAVECSEPRLVKHLNSKRPKGHPAIERLSDLPRARFAEAVESLRMLEARRKEKEAAK